MRLKAAASARFLPFGDSAVLVDFGDVISLEVNRRVIILNQVISQANIKGVEELVPTYRSLLVRYSASETSYERLVFRIKDEETLDNSEIIEPRKIVTIPVIYGGEYGPDLAHVANSHGLTEDQVVQTHTSRTYRVYMLGFVAGFPYMGEVADEIATPRLETPRLKVPAGSVGIAEKQTGVYPCEAPGGWQIVGRTTLKLFDLSKQPPVLVGPGDSVRFRQVRGKERSTIEKAIGKKGWLQRGRQRSRLKALEVLTPGFLTTVQDLGRYGYLRYGVPISGAMDAFSLTAANLLVGNDPNDAGLEMTITGPELSILANTQIAVTGGAVSPKINGESVPMWQTVNVQAGDAVSFGAMGTGCRSYLALRGGIDTALVLGSRSTYIRGHFGGVDGRQLRAGDKIEGFEAAPLENEYRVPDDLVPQFGRDLQVHVVLGPQADMFTEAGIETFFSSQYKVTSEADRMGYRLEGPLIEHRGKADIVSDALLPGAVQVPKSGKPIIMMRDAQTTGGYSKIAVVCTSDLAMLGQAKPDSLIEFSRITVAEAHRKLQEQNSLPRNLSGMLTRVR